MKQIGILVLSIFCLAGCTDRYVEYHRAQDSIAQTGAIASSTGTSLVFEHTVLATPTDAASQKIVTLMQWAKTRVYLNVYILTYTSIIDGLIEAHKRGVDVRIILERSVYQFARINDGAFSRLTQAGISIVWASEKDFNFDHAKYFLIDDAVIIGTWNMTKSSFEKNRDFFVILRDSQIRQVLEKIFMADTQRFPTIESSPKLVISPIDSRKKIEKLLWDATTSISIFAESLSDESLLKILELKKKNGLNVQICLAEAKNSSRDQLIDRMRKSKILVRQVKSPHVHAKTILVDDRILLIWSINYTKNSLDQNREIDLLLEDSPFLPEYKNIARSLCKS